jgi:SAM-dependent methyltransferase
LESGALRPLLVLLGMRSPRSQQEFDDRNHWWKCNFEDYAALPRSVENACELGCGPYTNMRLVSEKVDIAHIHCSDPLAREYVTYPKAWLANACRLGRVSVDFHPAEECPFKSDYFDLVIMINVLDHVRDAERCLHEAMRIAAPGGYFVFGQDLTGAEDRPPFNPGHPFLLTHTQLLPILKESMCPILEKLVPREQMSEPEMHYGALIYIGQKRFGG